MGGRFVLHTAMSTCPLIRFAALRSSHGKRVVSLSVSINVIKAEIHLWGWQGNIFVETSGYGFCFFNQFTKLNDGFRAYCTLRLCGRTLIHTTALFAKSVLLIENTFCSLCKGSDCYATVPAFPSPWDVSAKS